MKFLDTAVWLEFVDPKHRYSKSLMKYFRYHQNLPDVSSDGTAKEDFFSWLDFGDGKLLDLPWCPRRVLERRRVKYMNPEERQWFEVAVDNGMLTWKQSGAPVHCHRSLAMRVLGGKIIKNGTWIFVLSPDMRLYVGQKLKGRLHHSSFTAGHPTLASGNIHVVHGKLVSLTPKSGHYRPRGPGWVANLSTFLSAGGVKNKVMPGHKLKIL